MKLKEIESALHQSTVTEEVRNIILKALRAAYKMRNAPYVENGEVFLSIESFDEGADEFDALIEREPDSEENY